MSLMPLEIASSRRPDRAAAARSGWDDAALRRERPQGRRRRTAARWCSAPATRRSGSHKAASPGAVPGRVYTVEPTGDITFVQISSSTARSSTSACRPPFALAPDEPVWLEFDQERLHLFDGETDQALKAD